MSVTDRPAAPTVEADAFLKIEAHGIEKIPAAERTGRPREVALLWVAAFANFVSLITGGLLVALGLGLAVVAGLRSTWSP